MRSIFSETYCWLDGRRKEKTGLIELPMGVWEELLVSTILIPFAEFNLSSNWSNRVEATDSSMSGLGRSFGYVPDKVVKVLARYSSHKGVYTNLKLPWSVGLTKEHSCPLRRVRLPVERIKWYHVGTPWAPSHITLGEADAVAWAAEDRLRRVSDDGCRFVHPLDSAACVGAFSRGRSSSTLINKRCRRVAAVCIGGGHEVFYPWVPSSENPADIPSRWYEEKIAAPNHHSASGHPFEAESELRADVPDYDLRMLPLWSSNTKFFIHFCSGPDRPFDLVDMVERLSGEYGFDIVGIRLDPLAWSGSGITQLSSGDLLQANVGHTVLQLIK